MGKLTINGPFSIAMLIYQRVSQDMSRYGELFTAMGCHGSRTIPESWRPCAELLRDFPNGSARPFLGQVDRFSILGWTHLSIILYYIYNIVIKYIMLYILSISISWFLPIFIISPYISMFGVWTFHPWHHARSIDGERPSVLVLLVHWVHSNRLLGKTQLFFWNPSLWG